MVVRGAGQKRGVCVLRVAKNVVVVNKKANPGVSFMGYLVVLAGVLKQQGSRTRGGKTEQWVVHMVPECHTPKTQTWGCIDQFHRFPKKTATTVQLPTLL
jgi:hypothetical protein